MSRICICLISLFVSISAFSQNSFQKGYMIDNEGTRTESYINDKEWSRDPRVFSYKLGEDNALPGSVKLVKEIGYGETRYVRAEVQIDKSSSNRDKITEDSSPEWEQDTLLLLVLVDSKADLLYCKRNGEDRFFFRVDDGPITQLIHKLYRIPGTGSEEPRISTNNFYRNQLKVNVNCRGLSVERLKTLRYNMGVLITYFQEQNECWGGDVTAVSAMDRAMVHIKLKPGISFAHAEGYVVGKKYQEYDPGVGFSLGADFEFILPFHRKKWAVLLEPAFQSYSSKGKVDETLQVKYNSLETSMGIRHYFFLGKKASVFANGAAVLDVPIDYLTSFREFKYRMESTSFCAAVGLGGTFKRFSIEARYYTTRTTDGEANISTTSSVVIVPLSNDYQKVSIIFGYRLL